MTTNNTSFFSRFMSRIAAFFRRSKQDAATEITPDDAAHPLAAMSWDEFEQLVYALFKQRGYSVSEKHAGAYDGVDLVLHRDNEATYVQCKQWKEQEVDITAVGELYVAMESEGVKYGIVITSGVFTPDAIDFSLGKALLLINGVDLDQMIAALHKSNAANAMQEKTEVAAEPVSESQMPELEPLCPICSQKMIKRVARKGKNAGNTFWGCSQFPRCRGVISS